jgi:molybdopterin molybdotransferase
MKRDLSAAEALACVLAQTPVLGSETVSLGDTLGRVLGEDVRSARVLPPADNSAMDGYAVCAADCEGASERAPVSLPVAFDVPAGTAEVPELARGTAARILTGAPLPTGADSVVRQEDTGRDGDRVAIRVAPELGENVRRAGEDVECGELVLEAGARIGAAQVGMLASLGRTVVAVRQRPRVAVLSGGDELVEPDGDVTGGRIVSSNSWSIAAQCRELGAEPVYLGIARDTPDDIERRLRAGLAADVIVSSAGVSVGDRDFVRGVLEKLGCRLHFWGVKIKPGYPLAFGTVGEDGRGPLVFGLPGNPVSAMMTFEQFVRPALLHMQGAQRLHRPLVRARLAETLRKKPGRMHLVRVTLEREGDDAIVARSTGNQSSGVLKSMIRAQGILIFPAEASELAAGASALVQVLDADFLAADAPGFSAE